MLYIGGEKNPLSFSTWLLGNKRKLELSVGSSFSIRELYLFWLFLFCILAQE